MIRILLASLLICAVQQSPHRRSPYVGALSVDAASGKVLFEDNADRAACRGTFGGRRKAVRDRRALQGGTGDFP